ncbi:helix-turn-helix domain-containing protein [Hoeflea sp.]|uniref:helix-turn-helix domain-containing protein n=1 Tax=Hoeflea sp. TaxID=1940281 RepID=UPI003B02E8FF
MQHKAPSSPSPDIAANLARLRRKRGLTLDGLAEISSVSRAAISALENGASNPRIETLWSLANALGVDFGTLVGGGLDTLVTDADGIGVRLLERQTRPRIVEAITMDMPGGAARRAGANVGGVREHIVVLSGEMTAGPEAAPSLLRTGQSLQFAADAPHVYAAGADGCRAIVTVIYPEAGTTDIPVDHDLAWPSAQADWDAVAAMLARTGIEVQNGCGLSRLTFRAGVPQGPAVLRELERRVSALPPSPAIRRFVTGSPDPSVMTLYRTPQMESLGRRPERLDGPLAARCWELSERAICPGRQDLDREALGSVSQTSSSVTEATLAAEVLTRLGTPAVPAPVAQSCRRKNTVADGAGPRLFEARTDVDSYEAFELLHPAYARQALAVAAAIPALSSDGPANLLDVGTGPGLPLQMLLELLPDIRAVAVYPSEAAFEHLSRRFAQDGRVEARKASIADMPGQVPPFACAVSIGASHHLDTCDFLGATRDCLVTGTKLIVADEMIAPFVTREERILGLIRHHLWYILDTLVKLPRDADPHEYELAALLADTLPRAMALAHAGRAGASRRLARDTFEQACEIALPERLCDRLSAFSRFHMLELQALVAGFDYEVEQKTHPARFLAMAGACGFAVTAHRRIYATDGDTPLDGGTHLFVLEAV